MTTPRLNARMRRAVAGLMIAFAGLMSLPGCDPRTLMYFLQPFEPTIPAPGPSLKGKKVVVVAHAVSGAQGDCHRCESNQRPFQGTEADGSAENRPRKEPRDQNQRTAREK